MNDNESKKIKALRKEIVEHLANVPEGQMVKLDKELLEKLLFDKVTIDKEKGLVAKMPVWSGEFLRKIDLSQVDFEDVSWFLLNCIASVEHYYDVGIGDEDFLETFSNDRSEMPINYSFTNATIDFGKSFEAKNLRAILISNCNFEKTSLQVNRCEAIREVTIYDSNLANTGFIMPTVGYLFAEDSDLSNIDLSAYTKRGTDSLFPGRLPYNTKLIAELIDCRLVNTGLNIIFDIRGHEEEVKKNLKDALSEIKRNFNENWVGCYVNGKRILSLEEKKQISQQKLQEYLKEAGFESILNDIDSQIEGFSRK